MDRCELVDHGIKPAAVSCEQRKVGTAASALQQAKPRPSLPPITTALFPGDAKIHIRSAAWEREQ